MAEEVFLIFCYSSIAKWPKSFCIASLSRNFVTYLVRENDFIGLLWACFATVWKLSSLLTDCLRRTAFHGVQHKTSFKSWRREPENIEVFCAISESFETKAVS